MLSDISGFRTLLFLGPDITHKPVFQYNHSFEIFRIHITTSIDRQTGMIKKKEHFFGFKGSWNIYIC